MAWDKLRAEPEVKASVRAAVGMWFVAPAADESNTRANAKALVLGVLVRTLLRMGSEAVELNAKDPENADGPTPSDSLTLETMDSITRRSAFVKYP